MSKEQIEDVDRILKVLLASQRVSVLDLKNMLHGHSDAVIGNIIWKAREIARKQHKIDFGPLAEVPYYIERRTPAQTARYSVRQRRAGLRKQLRALERLVLAAEGTSDEKERARLERAAEREAERQNFSRLRGK